jgi:hypothetical protein
MVPNTQLDGYSELSYQPLLKTVNASISEKIHPVDTEYAGHGQTAIES